MQNKDLLTKRETIHLFKERLFAGLGVYRSYSKISPEDVRRIVFVCKGNICRSALAELYAKRTNSAVSSFGLECSDGEPANPRMIKIAAEKGISMSEHKTTSLKTFEFSDGDLLVAMDPIQVTHLKNALAPSARIQFALLGMYAVPKTPTIVDPYGKQERFFHETASIILQAIDNLNEALGIRAHK